MSSGNVNESLDISQTPLVERWPTLRFSLWWFRGPSIRYHMGLACGIHWSLKKKALLPLCTNQASPLVHSFHPCLMFFHIVDIIFLLWQVWRSPLWYLVVRTLAQRLLGFLKNLQARLTWIDLLRCSAWWRPRPPSNFLFVMVFQPMR